jgi:hypothetical protein
MLKEYENVRIDLGSIQYVNAAVEYSLRHTDKNSIPVEIQKIIDHPKEFKQDMVEVMGALYRLYREVQLAKSYKDLNDTLKEDAGVYDEYTFKWQKEIMSDNAFKFPVDPKKDNDMIKITIMEQFKFWRGSAWDLWSVITFLAGRLDTLDHSVDWSDGSKMGDFLYLLKQVYGFTDRQIQDFAGGFDT